MAKAAADSYAKIAPDAAHALHMPSPIYVALGRWDDVVTSNIASWNASIKRMERLELGAGARSYHAFNWLQYGFLQSLGLLQFYIVWVSTYFATLLIFQIEFFRRRL